MEVRLIVPSSPVPEMDIVEVDWTDSVAMAKRSFYSPLKIKNKSVKIEFCSI